MSQNEVEMYGVYGIPKPVLSASAFEKAAELGGPPVVLTRHCHVELFLRH